MKLTQKINELYTQLNKDNQAYIDQLRYELYLKNIQEKAMNESLFEITSDLLQAQNEQYKDADDYFKTSPKILANEMAVHIKESNKTFLIDTLMFTFLAHAPLIISQLHHTSLQLTIFQIITSVIIVPVFIWSLVYCLFAYAFNQKVRKHIIMIIILAFLGTLFYVIPSHLFIIPILYVKILLTVTLVIVIELNYKNKMIFYTLLLYLIIIILTFFIRIPSLLRILPIVFYNYYLFKYNKK